MDKLREIRDRIQKHEIKASGEVIDDIVAILDIMADIVDELRERDAALIRSAHIASCLANGIKPD